MEQGINNQNNQITTQELTSSIFGNSDMVSANTGYQIRTDENNNLRLEENEKINNKNNIANGQRYHLTRNQGNLTVVEDNTISLTTPQTGNLVYAIRRQEDNYTLTRTPGLMDYLFLTNNLRIGSFFEEVRNGRSRILHVVNFRCKIIKIGVLHTNVQRNTGLIDRNYIFQIIINGEFTPPLTVNYLGENRTRQLTIVQDIENLNLFLNEGDTLGLNYNGSGGDNGGNAVANYCEVRLTVDTNARRDGFEEASIP